MQITGAFVESTDKKSTRANARTPAHARAGTHACPRTYAPSCLRLWASFLLKAAANLLFLDRNGEYSS